MEPTTTTYSFHSRVKIKALSTNPSQDSQVTCKEKNKDYL